MTSRKQKIKSKREQEEKEIRQVRMAVAVVASLVVVGVIAYIVVQSGLLEPPPKEFVPYPETSGTPAQICNQHTPVEGSGQNGQFSEQPPMILEDGTDYRAIFCTTQGAIYLDLFEDRTPLTVNNMVFLAGEGFYNNLIFHRVIEGFMAQGGDPTGTGTGGPGYRFEDEFLTDLVFDRPYLLAMANSGPATNGSQFFITFDQTPWLNGGHTIFGEVISGQNVVDSLVIVDPSAVNPDIEPSVLQGIFIITDPSQVTE